MIGNKNKESKMYEDKIKKELFEKICESLAIVQEQQEIEKEIEDGTRTPGDDLAEGLERYAHLEGELNELLEEIDTLVIDTKYFPLVGLTDIQNKLFSIFADIVIEERNIDKYLDLTLVTIRDDIKERLQKVKSLFLTAHMHPRIHYLYREVVRCYINGSFEASCVLCRAIAELVAKDYIKSKKLDYLLPSEERKNEEISILQILKKKLAVPKEIIDLYAEIKEKANNILHNRNEKTEEKDSLNTIELLQSFIEKFPKML